MLQRILLIWTYEVKVYLAALVKPYIRVNYKPCSALLGCVWKAE